MKKVFAAMVFAIMLSGIAPMNSFAYGTNPRVQVVVDEFKSDNVNWISGSQPLHIKASRLPQWVNYGINKFFYDVPFNALNVRVGVDNGINGTLPICQLTNGALIYELNSVCNFDTKAKYANFAYTNGGYLLENKTYTLSTHMWPRWSINWWNFKIDNTAPELALNVPSGNVKGNAGLSIDYSDPKYTNGFKSISLKVGDTEVVSKNNQSNGTDSVNFDTTALNDGSYLVTAAVTDIAGNTVEKSQSLVIDNIGPKISINGSTSLSLKVGDKYQELGATATDAIDGNVPVAIDGTVDTQRAGTYQIKYSASDSNGNAASSITRTVTVSANPVPELTNPSAKSELQTPLITAAVAGSQNENGEVKGATNSDSNGVKAIKTEKDEKEIIDEKYWLWIIIILLLIAGGTTWYFTRKRIK